jgi:hypothetical protein
MALTQRSIGKSRHRMILLVLTAITLLSLDLSSFGPLGTAQRLVRDLLHPITEVAGAIVSPFSMPGTPSSTTTTSRRRTGCSPSEFNNSRATNWRSRPSEPSSNGCVPPQASTFAPTSPG